MFQAPRHPRLDALLRVEHRARIDVEVGRHQPATRQDLVRIDPRFAKPDVALHEFDDVSVRFGGGLVAGRIENPTIDSIDDAVGGRTTELRQLGDYVIAGDQVFQLMADRPDSGLFIDIYKHSDVMYIVGRPKPIYVQWLWPRRGEAPADTLLLNPVGLEHIVHEVANLFRDAQDLSTQFEVQDGSTTKLHQHEFGDVCLIHLRISQSLV